MVDLVEAQVIDNASPALRLISKRISKIAGSVRVGVAEGNHASGIPLQKLAAIHEFGSRKRKIPARPFLAPPMKANTGKYIRFIASQAPALIFGQTNSGEVMDEVGNMAVDDVIAHINTGNFVPLKASTIRRKGSSKPLIETGQLKRSIVSRREGGRDDALPFRGF